MISVLVTGGAGYIGSHATLQLLDAGYPVVVLDNLYSGHRWAVDQRAQFVEGDIADADLVSDLLQENQVDAVMHFAGHIVVPESVENPGKYYQNNVVGSLSLIDNCVRNGVNRFVFSSSAAVYGTPQEKTISEDTEASPINPYGTTKLMTEWTLRDIAGAYPGFRYVALRYFNVAGAHSSGRLGQATPAATHLIKVACQTACGQRPHIAIYGDDYDTPDGTCVRDYIHIEDLAQAHLDALSYINQGGSSTAVNCGYGRGYSVRQVIDCVKQVSGVDFQVEMTGRRTGDPASLVAGNARIKQLFNWQTKFDDLGYICDSAFRWEKYLEQEHHAEKH